MFFLGQHTRSLDDKARLTIPSAYRGAFEDGLVITRVQEPHLIIFTTEGWDNLIKRFEGKPVLTHERLANLRRLLFSNAERTNLDTHGRVRIPDHLRKHAQIGDQAVVAGTGELVEVWAPSVWEEKEAELNTMPISDVQQEVLGI